jgi:hypothetical protein
LIRCCWRFFKWGLFFTVAVGLVAVPYIWQRVDDEIRAQVLTRLRAHYPGLSVSVRTARLVEGQGIEVRGIAIRARADDESPLMEIDELFIECDTNLTDLAAGRLNARRFLLRRPLIRAARDATGAWNAAGLWPPPSFSERPLPGVIEHGTIEIVANPDAPDATIILRDVNLAVSRLGIAANPTGGAQNRGLSGSFLGDQFQRVEFAGWVDPEADRWRIEGRVDGLRLAPELRDCLPPDVAGGVNLIGSIQAQTELQFQVEHDPALSPPHRFDLAGQLVRGRIDDPRLPCPLTDLKADVHFTHEGFAIENLTARNGQTLVKVSCRQQGYTKGSELRVNAICQHLALERSLVGFLPRQWRGLWPKFLPSGEVDVTLDLVTNGESFRPDLTVRCRGVGLTYYKMPYRLERMIGLVVLKDDHLSIDLGDERGATRVRGEIDHPGVDYSGWVDMEAASVPFDESLSKAVGERTARVIRALNPQGNFRATGRIWRDAGPHAPLRKHAHIELSGCSMKYEKFAYSLKNIRGTIEMTDGEWTFTDLRGVNGDGRVTCSGRLSAPERGGELSMKLTALDVPLEGELHDALSPNLQRVWDEVRPRGLVNVASDIRYRPSERQLSVWCRVEPQIETASIQPTCFPLRLERLQGAIIYQDGRVTLDGLRGEHGRVSLATGGECTLLPEGGWRLGLRGLAIDRLRIDREFAHALPGRVKAFVTALNLAGPVNLSGNIDVTRAGEAGEPVTSSWDMHIDATQASLDAGVRLDNIQGGMHLVGAFDGRAFQARGELAIDSLFYKGTQFTNVVGPLWMDDDRVLLGAWAARPMGETHQPRSATADLFGGRVVLDAWAALGGSRRYAIQARWSDGDLATAMRPHAKGVERLAGKVHAQVELRGAGREVYNLNGRGAIQLRNAAISELPIMVSLLKLLRVRIPDKTAFNKSDIEFRVDGGHIYFDQINLNGDAISLLGTGEMNLNQEIRLTFHSIVGNDEFRIPGLRELLGGASQQTMLVHVGGTLQSPETRYEPFPALNHALQQLQIDLQPSTPFSSMVSPLPRGGE